MKKRKGISQVLAVLLLIVVAVSASLLIYLWIMGHIGNIQRESHSKTLQDVIKIDGVEKHPTIDRVYLIWLRNIGDTNVTLSKIYLLDATGQKVLYMDVWAGEWTIAPGQAQYYWFYIPESVTIEEGELYRIKVVTKNGFEAYALFRG